MPSKPVGLSSKGPAKSGDQKALPPIGGSPVVLPGIAAKAANAVVSRIIAKAISKHGGDAERVGQQVADDVASHLTKAEVPVKPPTSVTVKTQPNSPSNITSMAGGRGGASLTKDVSYVRKGTSPAQAASSQKGLDVVRSNKIGAAAESARKASIDVSSSAVQTGFSAGQGVGKVKGFVAGAATGVAGTLAAKKISDKNKKGK